MGSIEDLASLLSSDDAGHICGEMDDIDNMDTGPDNDESPDDISNMDLSECIAEYGRKDCRDWLRRKFSFVKQSRLRARICVACAHIAPKLFPGDWG